jgi:nitroreductase
MDIREAITGRRSIRSFRRDPVPREILERILEAGIRAPSPLNSQPWRFILVSGPRRDELVDIIREYPFYLADLVKYYPELGEDEAIAHAREFAEDLGGAPHLLVVTTPTMDNDYVKKVNLIACGIALENIALAAWAEGIGSVCLTSAIFVEKKILAHLGIEGEELVTVMPLGYVEEIPAPTSRDRSRIEFLE